MAGELPEALKTFRHAFDIRVFIDKNSDEWNMPMEWHTTLEIFLCLGGRGKYYIGNKIYDFRYGDIFAISNNELHKSELVDREGFEALLIMFDPQKIFGQHYTSQQNLLNLFYGRTAEFCHKYTPSSKAAADYLQMGSLMVREFEEQQKDYKQGLVSLLTWFLIDLSRGYIQNRDMPAIYETGERLKHKKIISEVLAYVEENFREDINLGELAARLYVDQAYLSREFKKSTGYSMMKFITNKRIREARELLRGTDLSVSEVAITVGYNNITHFNAMFKKEIGISPTQFRKQT